MNKGKNTAEDFRTLCADQQGTPAQTLAKRIHLHGDLLLGILVAVLLTLLFTLGSYSFPIPWGGHGYPRENFRPESAVEFLRSYGPVGLLYGWLAIACWIATRINHSVVRTMAIASFAIAASFLIPNLSTRSITDASASVVMFTLALTIGIHWGNIPHFEAVVGADPVEANPAGINNLSSRNRQFSIGNVLLLTTILALLFLLIQRTAVDASIPPVGFWLISSFVAAFNAIAVLFVFSITDRDLSNGQRVARLACSFAMVSVVLVILVLAEGSLSSGRPQLLFSYGSVLLPFWLLTTGLSVLAAVTQRSG